MIVQFLQAKGVNRQAGRAPAGRAAEHALPAGVIHVLLLATTPGAPLHHLVERVIREGRRHVVIRARGHVAPGIVAGRIDRRGAAGGGAGGADGIDAAQAVGMAAVAVEILPDLAVAGGRSLPELAQVGGDVATGNSKKLYIQLRDTPDNGCSPAVPRNA